jgi:hypothetical protein
MIITPCTLQTHHLERTKANFEGKKKGNEDFFLSNNHLPLFVGGEGIFVIGHQCFLHNDLLLYLVEIFN